jgi:hypothetical protein
VGSRLIRMLPHTQLSEFEWIYCPNSNRGGGFFLDPHPIPPFENTTTTTASPLATGWRKSNCNGNRGISPNEMFSFMSFSFSLFLLAYLS